MYNMCVVLMYFARRFLFMKKTLAIILLLSLLLTSVSALADDGILIEGTIKTDIPIKDSYENNPVIEGISPASGLPCDEPYTPIMMVLDNAENADEDNKNGAYPHWGVSSASVFYQIHNAGLGATKLMALFTDEYPEEAGGVRSGRMTMLPIAHAWNAAFAYAGPGATTERNTDLTVWLKEWKFNKTKRTFNLLGNKYSYRVKYHKAPHNLNFDAAKAHQDLIDNGVEFEQRPFLFTDEPLTRGEDAFTITVDFYGETAKASGKGNSASFCEFSYNEKANGYYRINSSGTYKDLLTDEDLVFNNVIVMRVQLCYSNDGYIYYKNHLKGNGTAEIFQNGKYIRGAWARSDTDSRIVYLDENGDELTFQRGKTFIVVTNDVSKVIYYND